MNSYIIYESFNNLLFNLTPLFEANSLHLSVKFTFMLFIVQNNMAPAGRALCGFYCFILPGKKNVNSLFLVYFSSLVSRTEAVIHFVHRAVSVLPRSSRGRLGS